MKLKEFFTGGALLLMTSVSFAQNNTADMKTEKRPKVYIGYYLKTLDNLLTQKIDSLHRSNGLTRAEWQLLNGVSEAPKVDKDELLEVVKQFTDYEKALQLLNGLIKKGFIYNNSHELSLTESGKLLHSRSLEMQKKLRERSMAGITPEAYNDMINTLQKMIQNLSQ